MELTAAVGEKTQGRNGEDILKELPSGINVSTHMKIKHKTAIAEMSSQIAIQPLF